MTPIRPVRSDSATVRAGRNATRTVVHRHAQRAARRPPPPRRWAQAIAALVLIVLGVVVIGSAMSMMVLSTAVGALSAGLPDPAGLEQLTFAQPTIVYDRTGKIELARFQQEDRRVVAFSDVPPLVLDATTSAEDRTFWSNSGFDPAAILSAVAEGASGMGERGASTITQQLVRARLLPDDVTAAGADRYIRKAKEIIQSIRLTDSLPGEAGKEQVVTAYLNEIFYGHGAYGVAAAAHDLLRRLGPRRPDARPGSPPGRTAQVALDPRSVSLRRPRTSDGPAGRPARTRRPSSGATGSWRASRTAPAGRRSLRHSSRRP